MTSDALGPLLPLTISTFVLLASIAVPQLFRRWPAWLGAVWRVAAFIILTVQMGRTLGSPFHPHFSSVQAGARIWEQLIDAGWWLIVARSAVGLTRLFTIMRHRPRETQILADLLAGSIYVTAGLAILSFVLAVPIRGMVATSGIIAIVVGLALQSTLSDIFSGIAVGLERPFRAGDTLGLDGGLDGIVYQVNWRSTQILTGDGNIAVVPNSVIAKSRLVNRSLPANARKRPVSPFN